SAPWGPPQPGGAMTPRRSTLVLCALLAASCQEAPTPPTPGEGCGAKEPSAPPPPPPASAPRGSSLPTCKAPPHGRAPTGEVRAGRRAAAADAVASLQAGHFEEASRAAEQALASDPENPEAHLVLAVSRYWEAAAPVLRSRSRFELRR